jgi:hypothetical protein
MMEKYKAAILLLRINEIQFFGVEIKTDSSRLYGTFISGKTFCVRV